ncbi:MAG: OmpH family outer membrane protein [Candidatus Omnitrophota bacterium]
MRSLKICAVMMAVIFVFYAFGAQAQGKDEGKIAYVDIGQLFDGYSKTDSYDKMLEEKYNTYEQERTKRLEKIQDARGKLSVLKKEEKDKLEEQIKKDEASLLDFDREQQTDLKKQRDERIREILLEIEKVVREFAEKGNYSIIINDKVLIYGKETLDITEQVLKDLNK